MSDDLHWLWLSSYEKSFPYNPYVKQIDEMARKGENAQKLGNMQEAINYYNQ